MKPRIPKTSRLVRQLQSPRLACRKTPLISAQWVRNAGGLSQRPGSDQYEFLFFYIIINEGNYYDRL